MSRSQPSILAMLKHTSGELVYAMHRLARRSGGWGTTTQMVALVVATLAASIILLSALHMRSLIDSAYQERSQFIVRQARNVERLLDDAQGDFRSSRNVESIQRFSESIAMIGGPSSFLFVDADGIVLAHSNPRRVGERYLDPRIAKALASGKAEVGQEKDEYSGRISLDVTAPVRYRGTIVGAVVAHFSLEMLDDDLAASKQAASISAMIVALILLPATALVVARFQRRLERMAITDGLSGLYQSSYLRKRLAQELRRSARYGQQFALVMLDIDDFKCYNDTYGHLVGDEAIKVVSQSLRSVVREVDIPARYGGEEFAAILPHTSAEQAYVVSERIRESVSASTSAKGGRLTVSLGIASYPADATTDDDLIRCADLALYYAKLVGKNRSVLYAGIPDRWSLSPVREGKR